MKKIISLILATVLLLSLLPMAVFAEGNSGEIVLPPDCFHSFTYANNGDDHTKTCKYCDGSVTEPHTFVDGVCVCGATETPAPTPVSGLIIYQNALALESYIGVQFIGRIPSNTTYDRVYLSYNKNDGGEPEEIDMRLYSGTRYFICELKVAPKDITNDFTVTIMAEKDGETFIGQSQDHSVRDMVISKMDTAYAAIQGGTSIAKNEAYMTMCADLLNYGTCAQIVLNTRLDDLANVGVNDAYMAYATPGLPTISGAATTTVATGATDCTLYGTVALSVASSVQVQPTFKKPKATAFNSLEIQFAYGDTVVTFTSESFKTSGNYFYVVFDALPAKAMRTTFTMTVCDASTHQPVGPSYETSIEALASTKLGSNESMTNLMNAMIAYGDSAGYYLNGEYAG